MSGISPCGDERFNVDAATSLLQSYNLMSNMQHRCGHSWIMPKIIEKSSLLNVNAFSNNVLNKFDRHV